MTHSPVKVDTRESHASRFSKGFYVKLILMALINAFGVYFAMLAFAEESWTIFAVTIVLLLVVNYVYFSKRTIPLKYLLPGLTFLLIFQVFVVGYTAAVAFTNYGTGHNSDKDDAIQALMLQNQRRVEGSPTYPLAVVRDGDELGFAVLYNDGVKVGTAEDPLVDAPDAVVQDGAIVEVPGFEVLSYQEVLSLQKEVIALKVAVSEDPNDGSIGTQDARNGYAYVPTLHYDAEADTMTNEAGVVFTPNAHGAFESEDGQVLLPGWRVFIGFENFTKAFGDSRYSGPFLSVLLWNFAFAFLSVATTFLLGLFFAIIMNDERMKGRKIYRTLMILPYAFPSFMTALLFAGMLNRRFGFVNPVLLGGAEIPWLTDPWLAKLALIGVNLWMGFPYMFLVCTGALQSIPSDMLEAAKIDGASRFRTWRSVTMPLLFIAVAPLLISSFAFNFNNFSLIYMLTGGGPRFEGASVPIGHTDILISMVYNVSGLDGSAAKDYGLASALSIVIFVIVATISALSFKKTQSLEDIN